MIVALNRRIGGPPLLVFEVVAVRAGRPSGCGNVPAPVLVWPP